MLQVFNTFNMYYTMLHGFTPGRLDDLAAARLPRNLQAYTCEQTSLCWGLSHSTITALSLLVACIQHDTKTIIAVKYVHSRIA